MNFSLFSPSFEFEALFLRQFGILQDSVGLLQTVFADLARAESHCRRIQELAGEGAAVTRDIDRQLSLTLIKPIDRQDIYELNRAFEAALKAVKAVAVRSKLYGLKESRNAARDLSGTLCEITGEIGKLLALLNTKDTGEEPREALKRLCNEGDMFLLVALGELYESAPARPVDILEIIKWAQIYDRLEHALDRTALISQVIEGIVLKNV